MPGAELLQCRIHQRETCKADVIALLLLTLNSSPPGNARHPFPARNALGPDLGRLKQALKAPVVFGSARV